jgi:hypothetical protein
VSCPRPGEKCKEFACGSSIDGMCMERPLPPPQITNCAILRTEENKNLADFKASVENIANMYAKIVENQLKDKKSIEELPEINEGIRLLNYIANTIERIDRLKN